MKTKLPSLTFHHRFVDGRKVEMRVKRRAGTMPEFTMKPRFCGAEDMETLMEFSIWRNEFYQTLLEVLTDDEVAEIIMYGVEQ